MKRLTVIVLALFVAVTGISADDEAPNQPVVAASKYGYCYAKSVPQAEYGEKGTTQVFRVERGADTLVQTYSWYAQELYIECLAPESIPSGISVVQVGPWPRGQVANHETLAIAFYMDGHLLKRYSTLDIAGSPSKVRASSDHYTVFDAVLGHRWGIGPRFVVRTTDGRTLVFDSETGMRVKDKLAERGP